MQTDWPRGTNRNSRKDMQQEWATVVILRKQQTEACKTAKKLLRGSVMAPIIMCKYIFRHPLRYGWSAKREQCTIRQFCLVTSYE